LPPQMTLSLWPSSRPQPFIIILNIFKCPSPSRPGPVCSIAPLRGRTTSGRLPTAANLSHCLSFLCRPYWRPPLLVINNIVMLVVYYCLVQGSTVYVVPRLSLSSPTASPHPL
jgi:hypothetical protein